MNANLKENIQSVVSQTVWMEALGNKIINKSLKDLILPGTHDSGSFPRDFTVGVRTQKKNFYEQLTLGIRYFDLRVCKNTTNTIGFKKGAYYLCHNGAAAHSSELWRNLDDILKFAGEYPKEIIILDFHRLLGKISTGIGSQKAMKANDVEELGLELMNRFKNVGTTYSTIPTVGQLWASGKNVVILFPSFSGMAPPLIDQSLVHTIWYDSGSWTQTLGSKRRALIKALDKGLQSENNQGRTKFIRTDVAIWTCSIVTQAKGTNKLAKTNIQKWVNEYPYAVNIFNIDFFEKFEGNGFVDFIISFY